MKQFIFISFLFLYLGSLAQVKEVYMYADMNGTFYLADGDSSYFWGYNYYNDESLMPITFPSPKLEFTEGDSVRIYMINKSGEGHTIHLHGLDADQSNDGVPSTSYHVLQGDTGVYNFVAAHAGNYIYHCHVTSTLHVTMGMYGPLVVKSKQKQTMFNNGPTFSKEYTYLASDIDKSWNDDYMNTGAFNTYEADRFLINGKEKGQLLQDSSQVIMAAAGDTVLLRLMNIGFNIVQYIFPSPLKATAYSSDGRPLPSAVQMDTLKIYPGERYGVLLYFNNAYTGYIKSRSLKMYNDIEIAFNEIGVNTFVPSSTRMNLDNDDLIIYPNPAANVVYIENTNTLERLKFLSLTGCLIKEFTVDGNQVQLNVNDLPSGIYLVQSYESGGKIKTGKVVIH